MYDLLIYETDNMKKKIIGLVISVIITLIVGELWYSAYYLKLHKYGVSFNDQRNEMKIPIIESTFRQNKENLNFWINRDDNFPQHSLKELKFEGNQLIIERDDFTFISGSKKMIITSYYHYKDHCFNIYVFNNGGEKESIGCDAANKIMDKYGFNYRFNKCKKCLNPSSSMTRM